MLSVLFSNKDGSLRFYKLLEIRALKYWSVGDDKLVALEYAI